MAKRATPKNEIQGSGDHRNVDLLESLIQVSVPTPAIEVNKEEQQLNVWIPKNLMKRLKVKGVETDQSLKEMVIVAIEQFL